MGDRLVLGGAAALYEPDRLVGYAGSAEPATTTFAKTPVRYPVDDQGSTVVRRIYLTVVYENGVSVLVTPVIDGREITARSIKIVRSGPGRETFMLDLMELGSAVQVAFDGDPPTGRYWVEKIVVMHVPASGAKRAQGGGG